MGTSYTLNYQSKRMPGYQPTRTLDIPLTENTVPTSLKAIELTISVAGRVFKNVFDSTPNQNYTFVWDGLDKFGRLQTGSHLAKVDIDYVYGMVYYSAKEDFVRSFAAAGESDNNQYKPIAQVGDRDVKITRSWTKEIAGKKATSGTFGGWGVNVVHSYYPSNSRLELGNGRSISASDTSPIISTIAGISYGFSGDGGPANQAKLGTPYGIDFDSEGGLYIADSGNHRIRYISPNGNIDTVVGEGTGGYLGDGEQAVLAQLDRPRDVAVHPDGSLYIADTSNHCIINREAQKGGLINGTTLDTLSTSHTHNEFGELTNYQVVAGNSAVAGWSYTRDKLGRITDIVEALNGISSSYNYNYNYNYGLNGELRSKTKNGITTTYDYDMLGNLTHATLSNETTIDYVIDGRNRRIGKKINGTLIQGFLYQDQINPIAELDGENNVVSRFVYGDKANVPSYMVKDGKTYRIISDHLGSPRLVLDTTDGSIVQSIDYDVWGMVTNDTNPGFQPFGFAGGIYDQDTQLVRFGARDYDSEARRWTMKDPAVFAGRSANLYGYVIGNPINLKDPSGFFPFDGLGSSLNYAAGTVASATQNAVGAASEFDFGIGRPNPGSNGSIDYYDFDPQPVGDRTFAAELATIMAAEVGSMFGGIPFYIFLYPCP